MNEICECIIKKKCEFKNKKSSSKHHIHICTQHRKTHTYTHTQNIKKKKQQMNELSNVYAISSVYNKMAYLSQESLILIM